ncbi:MAG: hypothetical protein K8T89_02635 [Planctomycetes bacterium]|nr:hypothetical protein [Planctomycetota bacterium]
MDEKKKLCMFCGKDESFGAMNVEHFVPRALWDSKRPQDTQTVPAHVACNSSFSSDNDYFRDIVALDEGAAFHPEVQKLMAGKIDRKFQKKPGAMRISLKDLGPIPKHSKGGIYLGHAPAFTVDTVRVERVLRNIMKGVFYSVREEPLPADFQFSFADVTHETPEAIREVIDMLPPEWVGFGDDVFLCRYAIHPKYRGIMAALLQFYRNRTFFGLATPSDLNSLKNETDAGQPQPANS